MENGKIAAGAITASTHHSPPVSPNRGRLNSQTSWCVSDQPGPQSWLQVDLGRIMAVKKVATQGRRDLKDWVTSYEISSRVDEIDWVLYAENGIVKVSFLDFSLACSNITEEFSLQLQYPGFNLQHIKKFFQEYGLTCATLPS